MTCFLQCSSGGSLPTFLVTFDEGSDEIRIASSSPFSAPMVNINMVFEPGNQIVANPPDFVEVDPTHFAIPNAHAHVASGVHLTHLDFYDADFNLLGSWDGYLQVPGNFIIDDLTSPAPATVVVDGQGFDAAYPTGTLRIGLVGPGSVPIDTYYDSSGPHAGLNPPGATMTVVGSGVTQATIVDPALSGVTIIEVGVTDDVGISGYNTTVIPNVTVA